MKTYIVVPAYNEEKTLVSVIKGLKKEGYDNIIVVDDGSRDSTYRLASKEKVILLHHVLNRGLGAALGTGIRAAVEEGAEIIVTFDSDGQHNPKDVKRVAEQIVKGNDVVIGSRLLNTKGMPWYRVLQNFIGNIVTYILFGVWTTDSQSGLRAFSREAAQKIRIKTNRMEVSSEIIGEIGRNKLKFKEVPIKPIYTEYSLSKGQSLLVGIKTFLKLVLRRIMG
jgi:glycosyltransferase involved in cell wall biosynthesis